MKALDDAELSLGMRPGWVKGLFRKGRALVGLKVNYLSFVVSTTCDRTDLSFILDKDFSISILSSIHSFFL